MCYLRYLYLHIYLIFIIYIYNIYIYIYENRERNVPNNPLLLFLQQFYIYPLIQPLYGELWTWYLLARSTENSLNCEKVWWHVSLCTSPQKISGPTSTLSRSFPPFMPLRGGKIFRLEPYNPVCSYTSLPLILLISKLLLRRRQNL